MRKLIVKLIYCYYAIKNINDTKLGETVIYKGEKFTLIQGVMNPKWDLFNSNSGRINRVDVKDFKQLKSFSGYWFRFKSHYNFLKTSWYFIDIRSSLFRRINYRS